MGMLLVLQFGWMSASYVMKTLASSDNWTLNYRVVNLIKGILTMYLICPDAFLHALEGLLTNLSVEATTGSGGTGYASYAYETTQDSLS